MRTFTALVLLGCLAAVPLSATSYIPMTDEALVDQAAVAVVVTILEARPAPGGRAATEYVGRIERRLKGGAPDRTVVVRVPGGVGSKGLRLKVWGAPEFAPGERALLFLTPGADGTFQILHLMLGAFHEIATPGRRFAVRDLTEARAVLPDGQEETSEPLRDFDAFSDWVAQHGQGHKALFPYRYEEAVSPQVRVVSAPFSLLGTSRWIEFDTGGSIAWRAHSEGQEGLTGGGFTEFQAAMAAWNADLNTPIQYTYAGTTTSEVGFDDADGINTILFNRNNGWMSPFSCSPRPSGTLAIGGAWFDSSQTSTFQGATYFRALEADVVTNAGIACYLASRANPSKVGEELFAHELGHTLGLGHSLLYPALMYPYLHGDDRGALLHEDDRRGILKIYGPGTDFFTLTSPCRLLDTRNPIGPFGGPSLPDSSVRTWVVAGQCGIPATAQAIVANVTIIAPPSSGILKLYAGGGLGAPDAVVTYPIAGRTRANNAILGLSLDSSRILEGYTTLDDYNARIDLVIDVSGYFQ